MSSQNVVLNTGQQAIINTDRSKIFLWNHRSQPEVYNNGTYDDSTIVAGTVMGRVTATGKVRAFQSDAVDGSQIPVGVLMEDYTVGEGLDQQVFIAVMGDVSTSQLVFKKVGDTVNTVVSSRQVRDHMQAQGLKLIASTQMTDFDNS